MKATVEYPMRHTLIEVEGSVDFPEGVLPYGSLSLYVRHAKDDNGDTSKPKAVKRLLRMVAAATEMHWLLGRLVNRNSSQAVVDVHTQAAKLLAEISGEE